MLLKQLLNLNLFILRQELTFLKLQEVYSLELHEDVRCNQESGLLSLIIVTSKVNQIVLNEVLKWFHILEVKLFDVRPFLAQNTNQIVLHILK